LELLGTANDDELRLVVIGTLGNLREERARAQLLRFLEHWNPAVRTQSILALGAIGEREDFDAMISAALRLPDAEFYKAIHGFRLLGEEQALDLLRPRLGKISDETVRFASERALESWKQALADRDRLLAELRSGSGWNLIEAIREVKQPVPSKDIQDAVLELLGHKDPLVRAESVVAVGRMHLASEFERVLEVTLALPEQYVAGATEGLVLLNDPRAIAPLEAYAAGMKNSERQRQLLGLVERIRRTTTGGAKS
jgi:HEAT repeat protein